MERTRTCSNPNSAGNGTTCPGSHSQLQPCNIGNCSNCDIGGACFRHPKGCQLEECAFKLTWEAHDSYIDIQIEAELAYYGIEDEENVWLGIGSSESGTMANSTILACLKTGNFYSAMKVNGLHHELDSNKSEVVGEGEVFGKILDGKVSCRYRIPLRFLTDTLQSTFYGAGPLGQQGQIKKHERTPELIADRISLITNGSKIVKEKNVWPMYASN